MSEEQPPPPDPQVAVPAGTAVDAPQAPQAPKRPKGLSGFTISAMVVGSLFGCCGVTGLAGQVVNSALSPALLEATTKGMDPELARTQRKMMERTTELQARTRPFAITTGLIGVLHSLALVIAAISAHNLRASGRRMLELVCVIGIGVEVIGGCFALYVASEQSAISSEMMKEMFATLPSDASNEDQRRAQEMMQSFGAGAARVGSIMGIVMVGVMFLLKTGYYLACSLYMRRKDVVAFYAHAPPQGAAAAQ